MNFLESKTHATHVEASYRSRTRLIARVLREASIVLHHPREASTVPDDYVTCRGAVNHAIRRMRGSADPELFDECYVVIAADLGWSPWVGEDALQEARFMFLHFMALAVEDAGKNYRFGD